MLGILSNWFTKPFHNNSFKNVYINNLKAVSIQILDQNNNEPPYLIKGKQYKAKMVIQNNGDLNIGAFKVGFYEQGTRKTQLDVSSLNKGASVTLYADFTATTTGNRTFMVNADDTNIIQESDKTDNKASTNKMVYINNLKAINIRILELDGTEPSHLVKNRRYKAEMVIKNDGELDVGAFKVGLYEQGSLKGRNDVTSLKKGQTTTIYQEFIAATPGQRTFKMVVDDTNVIEETDETDNTASTTILVNTPPTFTMRYDPADVYEGDDVSVCINPNDEDNDPMTVILEMSKDGGPYQVVLNNSGVNSGEVQCYDISFIEQGNYRFRATVSDGYDSNSGTISFEAKQLIIIGRVLHTPQWTLQHERLGNEPHQFYSGEEFVLESDITNYPANYVKVFFQGEQVNGNMLNLTTNLTQQSNVLYTGSLYDQSMSRASTQLKNGTVTFTFEVEYTNGMIKRDTVDVEIIGSVFSAFNFHRRY